MEAPLVERLKLKEMKKRERFEVIGGMTVTTKKRKTKVNNLCIQLNHIKRSFGRRKEGTKISYYVVIIPFFFYQKTYIFSII